MIELLIFIWLLVFFPTFRAVVGWAVLIVLVPLILILIVGAA